MGLRLLIADSATEVDAAREVEARVFLEAFGNTPETMAEEYGQYADRSRFVTVLDETSGTAVGAARIIVPDETGEVKTLTDVAGGPWQLPLPETLAAAGLAGSPVWDSATLAVAREHRRSATGAEVALALVHGLYEHTRRCGVRGAVTILDDHVLALVQSMGVPWVPLPGATSQSYLGSPGSTPCSLLIDAYGPSVRAVQPDLAPALVEGTFATIAVHPADLDPDRGVALP